MKILFYLGGDQMKKILALLFVFMMIFSTTIFAWDDDDDDAIDNLTAIGKLATIIPIKHYLFDLNVHTPLDYQRPSYPTTSASDWHSAIPVPGFFFRVGLPINDMIKLGIVGQFHNAGTFTNQKTETNDATNTFKETETIVERDNWTSIRNTVDVYLGLQLNPSIYLAVVLGGGTDISNWTLTKHNDNKTFDNAGNTLAGSTAVEGETKNGSGIIRVGAGVNLKGDLFNAPVLAYMDVKQLFVIRVAGNGSITGGNTDNTKTTTWTGVNTTSLTEVNNKYEYFAFQYLGDVYAEFELKNVVSNLSNWNRFRAISGLYYEISPRFYSSHITSTQVAGVFTVNTNTTVNGYLYSRVGLWGGFDIRPIEAVQIRFRYNPVFDINYKNYEETVLSGVVTKYTNNSTIRVIHNFDARTRFIFPKVIRLTLGARWGVTQTITVNEQEVSNPLSKQNPYWTYAVSMNAVSPTLGIDYEIVKDYAIIETSWNPVIVLADSADTNLLNLANWALTTVIRIDPKKLEKKE